MLKLWAYGSVFLIAPFVWLTSIEDNAELEKYKAKSIGVVTSAHIVHRRKRKSVWNIQAEYRIDGKTYMTSYKEDEDQLLNKGDTITILYSSKTPQMSEVLELIEYYEKQTS